MERHRPPRGDAQVCPLCRDPLSDAASPIHTCPACRTDYHEQCLGELGGCSTLGCALKGRGPAGQAWKPRRAGRRARMAPHDLVRRERERTQRRIAGGVLGGLTVAVLAFVWEAEMAFDDALVVLAVFAVFAVSVLFNLDRLDPYHRRPW